MDVNVTVRIQCPELATAILTLADVFGDYLNASAGQPVSRKALAASVEAETAAAAGTAQPAAAEEAQPQTAPVSLEEVRAELAKLSQAGHADKVKDLIRKAGANQLTKLSPDKYPELLAAARAIA